MKSTNHSPPDCLYQYSLHASHLTRQQQHHPNPPPKPKPKPKPKQQDHPPISFLTSYGDHGYALTPTGNVIALLNSQTYEFPSSSPSPSITNTTNNKKHPTRTPSPNTPLSFALVTLFHPENRIATNLEIDPNPNSYKYTQNPPVTLTNLRIVMALKGKFQYDGRDHATPFAVRGAFRWIQLKSRSQGQQAGREGEEGGNLLEGVQGVIFGFLLPGWMRGAIGGPEEVLCCFVSGCRGFGGEVEGFESVEGTFLEWATSDHFRLGLAKENGLQDV
jgi:hypothetical protein